KQGDQSWQDEVLMIQEGQCWVIDDVRYLGGSVHATAGTLRQSIENR
ncbi:lipoprotein, partial [Shigella boydii]